MKYLFILLLSVFAYNPDNNIEDKYEHCTNELFNRDVEIELVARVIYNEARGESFSGKVAVGNVILNRVANDRFPATVRRVVFQKKQFATSINKYDSDCYKAAQMAFQGVNYVPKNTYFFCNEKYAARKYVNYWNKNFKKIKLQNHSFYAKR